MVSWARMMVYSRANLGLLYWQGVVNKLAILIKQAPDSELA